LCAVRIGISIARNDGIANGVAHYELVDKQTGKTEFKWIKREAAK
jgi:hypothetical protein